MSEVHEWERRRLGFPPMKPLLAKWYKLGPKTASGSSAHLCVEVPGHKNVHIYATETWFLGGNMTYGKPRYCDGKGCTEVTRKKRCYIWPHGEKLIRKWVSSHK